jgi:hypothetical protein
VRALPFLAAKSFLWAMLSLPVVLLESVQAQETINIWERTRSTPRRDAPQPESEEMRRVSGSIRRALESESLQWETLSSYAIFLSVVAVLIAGYVGWQMWRQKRTIWELNDPIFLVNELNSAHKLSEQEKRLMRELSEKNSLSTPLKLFVEPKFLLDAWENETFPQSQLTVQQLLSKLFDIAKV